MVAGKNLSARGRQRGSTAPHFILGPLYIFEINRARKLKFGTQVDIYIHYGIACKHLSASLRGVWGSGAPYFILDPLHIFESRYIAISQ